MTEAKEELTRDEREQAFMAIVEALDRECCVGAACVQEKHHDGLAFSMYVSAERCRRWIAHAQGMQLREDSRSEAEAEGLQPGPAKQDAP